MLESGRPFYLNPGSTHVLLRCVLTGFRTDLNGVYVGTETTIHGDALRPTHRGNS